MSTVDPHRRLEQSYRRLLWLFPPSYRRARGREVVDVLMERADPGQVRPSRAEMAALLRFGVRTWVPRIISPSPAVARNAMGIVTVVLPMLLLFPAASALHIWGVTGGFRLVSLPFGADVPAWVLWCITAVLILFGPASWPRYSAILAAIAYLVATIVQYENNNFLVVGKSVGLLAVQVVAALTMTSSGRLRSGRLRIPIWFPVVLGSTAALLGFLASNDAYRQPFIYSPVLLPITVAVAAVLGLSALLTATGRALLPIFAALAGANVVAKYLSGRWGNNQSGLLVPWSPITGNDVLLLIGAPIAIFVVVRVVTAVVDLFAGRNTSRRGAARS